MHACLYFIAPSGHRLKVFWICNLITEQYKKYVLESNPYQFPPPKKKSGKQLFKALDLEFMRRLCTKVNIIPVIGEIICEL